MEKQPHSQRWTVTRRGWSIVAAFLLVSFSIGSWAIVSHMAHKQSLPPGRSTVVSPEMSKDVYTAYKDVVYKISGRNGSVIWTFALKQAHQPDRSIGSYLQLDVVNGVVYIALEYGVYALHASSGKELWHYLPQLTPTLLAQGRGRIGEMFVDKSVMYLELTYGDMVALDLRDGSLKWNQLSFPNGGSFSPSDDTLYASEFSGKNEPLLHAIDGRTGKERWRFARQLISTSLSSTFIFDGVVYSSGDPLYALDARTGKELWEQHPPDGPAYFTNLQLRNGVVYVNTGAALNSIGSLVGEQTIPLDPFRVFAFDARTGKQLWESQPGYRFRDDVINNEKSILVETVAQQEYSLQALDAMTGTLRWQLPLNGQTCDTSGSCSLQIGASESQLSVLSGKQPYTLQVFDTQTGKQVRHYPVAIAAKEGLNLSAWGNDTLYIRSSVHEGDAYSSGSSTSFTHYFIYAIHLTNGTTSWKYDIGSLLDVQVPITELQLAP